jgi:hypothetical protein
MAAFNTRVELHDADYQDYLNLHSYMAQEGYTNTIRADDGATYELPPAEYNLVAHCTIAQALEKAQRAAQKTRKTFAVLVSEYTSSRWVGLAKVRSPAPSAGVLTALFLLLRSATSPYTASELALFESMKGLRRGIFGRSTADHKRRDMPLSGHWGGNARRRGWTVSAG